MPELPEVEAARRRALDVLAGSRIARCAAAADRIVYAGVGPRAVAAKLRGRTVEGAARRGKYFWLELDRRPWPVIHLGMSGRIVVDAADAPRPRFWKLELVTDAGRRVTMTNPRRLGRIRLLDDPPNQPPIDTLGFDPLTDMAALALMRDRLRDRAAPIKGVLLDQSFAAGVGNWIADEVLYQAGIAPQRRACDLAPEEVKRLRTVLGRVICRAVDVDADKDRFPKSWLFHHRWGKRAGSATARGEAIAYDTVAGRTTAWVPVVQK